MLYCTTRIRLIALLILNEIASLACALPRTKEVAKNGIAEPTCEELKAMWRFSKRQSRAAEITNEIPMYRDPFVDNVWEPYFATSRSIGGQRISRHRSRPIYGRIIHDPSYLKVHNPTQRHKAFEEVARLYGMPPQSEPRRKITTFRLPGGRHRSALGFPPQQGSFQHLKELIKTERARELQQQRASEEAAARAAALKDLANENRKNQDGFYEYGGEDEDLETNTMGNGGNSFRNGGALPFPDLLAPGTRINPNMARFMPDYSYTRGAGRTRAHRPTLFDPSFENGYSGYLP
ncbi:hypothetical protein JTB14_001524 [Gonioctena quinquepunctata]|nr:hypothetical protein JTB14_001524 [Gonioctena quinquepunctata]